MEKLPDHLKKLMDYFQILPGVGEKTAQRFAFHLLKKNNDFLKGFGTCISQVKEKIKECEICHNFSEEKLCKICLEAKRNKQIICIVENPFNLISIEKSNSYNGVYHVLHGVLSPLDGIGIDEIRLRSLFQRIEEFEIQEVILALNPTLEGDATNNFIFEKLKSKNLSISVIARGISVGGDLDYSDEITISKSIQSRFKLK